MASYGSIEIRSRTPGRVRLRAERPLAVEEALLRLGFARVKADALTGGVLIRLGPDDWPRLHGWLESNPLQLEALAVPAQPALSRSSRLDWQTMPEVALAAATGFSLLAGAVPTAAIMGTALAGHLALGRVARETGDRRLRSGRSLMPPTARRLRGGQKERAPLDRLARGDVILLKKGDVVPADGRLLEVDGLITGEAALSGRTQGQVKSVYRPEEPEHKWMVYAGTTVVSGRGRAEVVTTGSHTTLARLKGPLEGPSPLPLDREVSRFGERFGLVTLGACLGLGALALASGVGLLEILPAAAALTLTAMPKGLPALAASSVMGDLRRRRAVVRKPKVLQVLGRATIVCLDKTGTLTREEMSAKSFVIDDMEFDRGAVDSRVHEIRKLAVLCSTVRLKNRGEWVLEGSGTERALLQEAIEAGLDVKALRKQYPLERLWDRTGPTSFMMTRHTGFEGLVTLVKGAPETLVRQCNTEWTTSGPRQLDAQRRRQLLDQISKFAGHGLRVLGFARAEGHHRPDKIRNLTWLGMVTLDNPIRPAVREALRALKQAGLRPLLVTGDHPETAARLARELEIGRRLEVSGPGLKEALARRIPDVLARASQEDKEELLAELRRRGEVVIMLGHDQRDMPVLRHAHVGITHGPRGSQWGADSADVVLLDDDLNTLPVLVEQSRGMVRNQRDVLHFLASSGLADLMLVGATLALRLPLSMSPMQRLWTTLVTDMVAAFALAVGPTRPGYRGSARLEDPLSPRVLREALTLAGVTLGGYLWGIDRYGKGEKAQTLAFTTATLCEIAYARAQRPHHGRRSGLAIELAGVAQAATVIVPNLHKLLGTRSLKLVDWGVAALGAGAVYAVTRLSRSGSPQGLPQTVSQRAVLTRS